MSREFTKEEVREQVLKHVKTMVAYWSSLDLPPADKCDGIAFSILTMIDGVASVPPLSLWVETSEEWQQDSKNRGEDYYPLKVCINDDVMLHELYVELPDIVIPPQALPGESDTQSESKE